MNQINRKIWVYDIETLQSCWTYTARNVDTNELRQFVLHTKRWQLKELIDHLLYECNVMIGFNNVNFDYPVLHYMLQNHNAWEITQDSEEKILYNIYKMVQWIINCTDPFGTAVKAAEVLIPQIDLFRLWHFNNKARMQSLKGLEIAMHFPNVMDMPIHHDRTNITIEEVDDILEYNLNDVDATLEFYKKSLEKLDLRADLDNRYGLRSTNFPDSRIGEELTLKLYCEASGLNIWDVKKLRTERPEIALNDCIFDYISYKTPEFNQLLDSFRKKTIIGTKGTLEASVVYNGFIYDFGTGGIHGCIKPGVYTSDEEYVIRDADVASLYPSIAVQNGLYPAHLGPKFCEVYEGILKQRIVAKRAGNMSISDALKLSLNSVYGKSNDKYSFLYDPLYTMKTTLNGQLMLTMLCEEINLRIPDIQMLQVNTDGFTVKIKKDKLDLYNEICKNWEILTKLELEYVDYSKMIIRDVNNYIAVTTNGKVKEKGAFETKKDWHKDNSFMIVPIALKEFFVNGTPVEQTIKEHQNIYNFCGRQKFRGADYGYIRYLKDGAIVEEKQQKNVRYFITNKGASFIKHYHKGSDEIINVGYDVKIFNKYYKLNIEEYNIDYTFYIKECYKEINQIINKQYIMEF